MSTPATDIDPETGYGSWFEAGTGFFCIRSNHEVEPGTHIRATNKYGPEYHECEPCVFTDTQRYFAARNRMKGGDE